MKKQFLSLVLSMIGSAAGFAAESNAPPNVLLLMVDDLKPLLGCYGDRTAITPNIDALASRGALFERAACQISLCAPSRASILTGLRPDTLECYVNGDKFRKTCPDVVTLPQAFERAGWHTVSVGKVYDARNRDPGGWSEEMMPSSEKKIYALAENEQLYHDNNDRYNAASIQERQHLWRVGPATEAADLDESRYWDGQVAAKAIETLRRIQDKPFFLAVGFVKPHLPFACPKKYWDLYDRDRIPLPPNPDKPTEDIVEMAYHEGFELRQYQDIPRKGKLSEDLSRTLIHGYYACASFADAMVGRVLSELDLLGLTDNTVIVLLGDHGWHLGDKEIWCKFTAFRESSVVPLMVIDPRSPGGRRINGMVELVDLCPTLCELAGVEPPSGLEGRSFVPLLNDVSNDWKTAVFTQAGRGSAWKEYIGTSMRTDRYNYIEWRHRINGNLRARELYDLKNDPLEMKNLAGNPEHKRLLDRLAKQMFNYNRMIEPVPH
jgi:arylsulfatase A-like enzyme